MERAHRGGRPQSGEPLLTRAFRLLDAFTADAPALTVTELSKRTGTPLSSTSRLVQSLARLGALERADDGTVTVGIRMLEYAALAPRGHGLRAIALPYMEDLHRATGEHVQLAVRENDQAVIVERLSSSRAPKVLWHVGARIPLHSTGLGLILLAHAPDDFQEIYLASATDLCDDDVDVDPLDLRTKLREVRSTGIARSARVHPEPTESVAAPVFDRAGQCVAALSVLGSGGALAAPSVTPAVVAIARVISRDVSRVGRSPMKRGG